MPLAVRSRKILMVNLTNIAEGEGGALHQLSLARCFRKLGHGVKLVAPDKHSSAHSAQNRTPVIPPQRGV